MKLKFIIPAITVALLASGCSGDTGAESDKLCTKHSKIQAHNGVASLFGHGTADWKRRTDAPARSIPGYGHGAERSCTRAWDCKRNTWAANGSI